MPGLGTPQGIFLQLLSTPSVAADVDSGPDSAPDPGTDEEDERDTRLPGEDLSKLPPAPLGRGRRGEEGKELLLPTGREAAGRLQGGCSPAHSSQVPWRTRCGRPAPRRAPRARHAPLLGLRAQSPARSLGR